MRYDGSVFQYAISYGNTTKQVAEALGLNNYGITQTAISGAILEEINDRFESTTEVIKQWWGDNQANAVLLTQQGIRSEYEEWRSKPAADRLDIDWPNKLLLDPIFLDLGPGNIQGIYGIPKVPTPLV